MCILHSQHISILATFQGLASPIAHGSTLNRSALDLSLQGWRELRKRRPLEGSQVTTLKGDDKLLKILLLRRSRSALSSWDRNHMPLGQSLTSLGASLGLVRDFWLWAYETNKRNISLGANRINSQMPKSLLGTKGCRGISSELQKQFMVQLWGLIALSRLGTPESVL